MEKRDILFKENMELKGKRYLAGYAYSLELEPYEFNRLTRMGCVYASKDAKYYKEETVKVEEKVAKKAKKKKLFFEDKHNVDNSDSQQAELQANESDKD